MALFGDLVSAEVINQDEVLLAQSGPLIPCDWCPCTKSTVAPVVEGPPASPGDRGLMPGLGKATRCGATEPGHHND